MNRSNPKNICLFNSCKTWGGGEKWHFEIALKLKDKGYDVFMCTNKPSELYDRIKIEKINALQIRIGNLSFLNPIKLFRLYGLFKKLGIKTIILGLSSDVKCAGLAAKFAGVNEIIYRRGLASPIKNTWLNQVLFKKVITKVITNSNEVKRRFIESMPSIAETSKIHIIYNGIDLNKYLTLNGKNGFHKLNQKIVIGNSGRLIEEKGQKYLIELANNLRSFTDNFTIQVAGKGKLKTSLETYAKKMKVEGVIKFLDFVEDTNEFYKGIDIFVFPSVSEGFSNAILEAMIYGKPVVAFNISSMPEIVDHGITGYLVEYDNIQELTEKVKRLMDNPEIRYEMGKAAKQKIALQFDLNKNLYQLESII
jgi:glycosyltransferase involved in cell wall biosynthesis